MAQSGRLTLSFSNGAIRPLDALRTTGMDFKQGQGFIRAVPEDCVVFKSAAAEPRVLAGEGLRDIHDVLISGPWIYAVGTDKNAIYQFDHQGNIDKGWQFARAPDAWHLNCLAEIQGKIYVSAFGEFASSRGYKENSFEKGFVQCLDSGERVVSGLSQPHSLCAHEGRIYLANSETGDLLVFDAQFSLLEKIHVGGYLRGIAFADGQILVGVSYSRNVPVEAKGNAKIMAIDPGSKQMRTLLQVPTREIYSILSVPHMDDFVSVLSDLSYTTFSYFAAKFKGNV